MKLSGRFSLKAFPLLGTLVLNALFLAAQTAGPHCASIITNNGSNGGEATWENTHLAACDDNGSRAISDLIYGERYSEYLHFSGFELDVPEGAEITGIEVVMIRRSDRPQTVFDRTVRLVKNGQVLGKNLASPEGWDLEWTAAFYGGEQTLWGTDWTSYDVMKSGFGVVVDVKGKSYSRAEIDEVLVSVYYKEHSPTAGTAVRRTCQSFPAALGI